MQDQAADGIHDDDALPPAMMTPHSDAVPPVPQRTLGRTAAIVAMSSVALAILLLMLAPGITVDRDRAEPTAVNAPASDAAESLAPAARVGKDAPLNFTLRDMNGVDVKLSSFKGKVILLNFWATWCGPCRAEIPSLIELQHQYSNDLVVLGFSVDDSVDKLKPYAAEFKMNYPVLVGAGHEDVQDAFGPIWGIPVSIVIGRDGKVAARHSGIATKEQFEQEIKALL